MTYLNARITALDLSRSSLAYGARMAEERGIDNIAWLHGDILDLHECDQQFDLIECAGVLHHMRDPLAGWRTLIDRLAPGGVMRIALYSELGRQDVTAARAVFAAEEPGPMDVRLRRFRTHVRELPEDHPAHGVVRRADFYTLSTCRDLVAHVQEHRFTLPQIAAALETLALEFLGFELHLPPFRDLYREQFPKDVTATDLALWHCYEQAHPNTFRQMYTFWVRPQLA